MSDNTKRVIKTERKNLEVSTDVGIAFFYIQLCQEEMQGKKENPAQKKKTLIKPHSKKSWRPPKDRNDEATNSTFQNDTNEGETPNQQILPEEFNCR